MKRYVAVVVSVFAALWLPITTTTAEVSAGTVSEAAMKKGGAVVKHQRQTGLVNFIGGTAVHPVVQMASGTAAGDARAAAAGMLQQYGALFGLGDPASEVVVTREVKSKSGRAAVRYQQLYQGVPIVGGELIVNLDKAGNLLSIGGKTISSRSLALATMPTVSPSAAQTTAIQAVAKWQHMAPSNLVASDPVLSVYDPRLLTQRSGPVALVWKIKVSTAGLAPVREFVLVNARKPDVVTLHFNEIADALNRQTFDLNNTPTDNVNSTPGTLVCGEGDGNCNDPNTGQSISDAVKARQYAGDTYFFYLNNHNRDGLDDAGMSILSTVRYCDTTSACPYVGGVGASDVWGAFWNGQRAVYGQGFSQADDVVAHELTHAVTERTSGLFYYYQSGAINESFSDLWGEFVDQTNNAGNDTADVKWLIGEDIPVTGAIRSMSDPTQFGDPDKMSSPNYVIGNSDNGGVHHNSGINNKAAYLMTDGGTFNGQTVTGLGIPKTASIYYEAQTHLLTRGSDYSDLAVALNQCLPQSEWRRF